ncbi:hypothetical protein [Pedobacter alpinus]|uniref:Uncharacterized protein n=1 Tax=Pedobacter alpinus TaxID=1590643 RepID=A0ABW5TM87_9SPHI
MNRKTPGVYITELENIAFTKNADVLVTQISLLVADLNRYMKSVTNVQGRFGDIGHTGRSGWFT